jgi:hypothetical protein
MPLLVVVSIFAAVLAASQPALPDISGVWVLNPALTERPAEIGFSPDWAGGGGRRGRSGDGMGIPQMSRENVDDSTRVQQLTGEARTPPSQMTIVQKADSVSIADDQGHSRTFHPNGRSDDLTLGTVALPTTARWDAGGLVVLYDVSSGRQLRLHVHAADQPGAALGRDQVPRARPRGRCRPAHLRAARRSRARRPVGHRDGARSAARPPPPRRRRQSPAPTYPLRVRACCHRDPSCAASPSSEPSSRI